RNEPPQDLRSDVDAEYLGEMLREIPIPVVALPPGCVDEPWRLAYIAHEVGHHVQTDFLPKDELITKIGVLLQETVDTRWRPWSHEIFADLYSLLTLGPWALWALTEAVWGAPSRMLDDTNGRYPCPLVRLLLMKALADRLCLDGNS